MSNIDIPVAVTLIAVSLVALIATLVADRLAVRRARRRRVVHERLVAQAHDRSWASICGAGVADDVWDAATRREIAKEDRA